mmetsp:Transcript_106885/g.189960  ORF Transcript_106885/g.189960 Transcript_106885/m.189960 type:complete len:237 (-) Transcript_106885:44-754(-)
MAQLSIWRSGTRLDGRWAPSRARPTLATLLGLLFALAAAINFVRPSRGLAGAFVAGKVSQGRQISHRRFAIGATIDKPPPPAGVGGDGDDDGNGGKEEVEVRFVENQERMQIAQSWLFLASDEDKELLEKKVIPFVSTQSFTGKARLCIGAFVAGSCQALATTEIAVDLGDFASFLFNQRRIQLQALVTKPRVKSLAAESVLQAVRSFADEEGMKTDFRPLETQSSGRYWIYARSL